MTNDHGKSYAREIVRVAYQAPDHKSFQIESEEGSAMVRSMVLKRLIAQSPPRCNDLARSDTRSRWHTLGRQNR